jgi:hypothetical protein
MVIDNAQVSGIMKKLHGYMNKKSPVYLIESLTTQHT